MALSFAKADDVFRQIAEVEGLEDKVGRTRAHDLALENRAVKAGVYHEQRQLLGLLLAHGAHDADTVDMRHKKVHDDHVGLVA